MENIYIDYFINEINKGPFKSLKEKHNGKDSDYVVARYHHDNPNLAEKDIYHLAVDQAYLDMCRTMSIKNSKKTKDYIIKVENRIANELKIYFEEVRNNEGWIDLFIDLDDNRRKDKIVDVYWKYSYGKLQKIVNMAFKYLYCCDDLRNDKKLQFVNCHMPLDSLILSWMIGWLKDNNSSYCKIYRDKSWSALEQKEYMDIQRLIKKRQEREKWQCSILEKEFEVWIKQKNAVLIKEMKTCLKACNNSYFNCEIKKKIPSFDDFDKSIKDLTVK